MSFIDASGYGLAGAAADAFTTAIPTLNLTDVVAPALDPAAIAGAVAPLAEDGANAATALVPNLTPGLAATTNFGPWAQAAGTPLTNSYFGAGWTPSTTSIVDGIKDIGTDTMKFFNDNSKSLEAGGKLIGGLGGLYYQNQMAGLAKQQLNDSRANTAYNRARQATGDANLQSASDRVFGKYNG